MGAVRRGIVGCCVGATVGLWSLVGGSVAAAQEPAAEVGQAPSPDVSMKAYRAVDEWVRGWKVGEEAVPECVAASVTLRMDGEVMGRGVAMGERCLAAATKQAIGEAEPKLGAPRDALYQVTLKDLAKRMTVSVQLAGELVPITIKDAADAAAAVAPGMEGAGARLGDRVLVMFPERMLTMGTEPGPALASLVAKLGDDASLAVLPLSMLAKEHGAVYYRFKVSHLAQVKAGDTPRFLSRCGRVVGAGTIDQAELRRWAHEMAMHLIRRRTIAKDQWGIDGFRDPIRGVSDPERADRVEQATVALSLRRYSKLSGLDMNAAKIAKATSEAIIGDTVEVDPGGHSSWEDPVVAAAWLLAVGGRIELVADQVTIDNTYITCEPKVTTFFAAPQEFAASVPAPSRGLVLLAMKDAMRYADPSVRFDAAGLAAVEQTVWSEAGGGKLSAMMPWFGWSQARWTDLSDGSMTAPVPAAQAFRDMRDQMWSHQIQADGLPGDQLDLGGGVVFTTARSPMPTWHMARPLAFIATMLGDPRLTEDKEVSTELLHLLDSLRFLRQLTVREAECFMYREPEKAIGGVRSSLWDQRMPPEATAMTLMAVCETLRSLEEIQKREKK